MGSKRLQTALVAVVVTIVAVVGVAGPAGASHWVYVDALGDGGVNTAAADRNNDGWFDIAYIDVNYDGTWDIAMWDQDFNGGYEWVWAKGNLPNGFYLHDHNGDGYLEHGYFDIDGNGLYEIEIWDGNRDAFYEYVALDYSGDGSADTWVYRAPSAPAPTTAARIANDTMVKHIVTMSQLRQCLQPGRC